MSCVRVICIFLYWKSNRSFLWWKTHSILPIGFEEPLDSFYLFAFLSKYSFKLQKHHPQPSPEPFAPTAVPTAPHSHHRPPASH